jgi:glutathione synthase/RimK-type ligase-like ATP-grasp enzyme
MYYTSDESTHILFKTAQEMGLQPEMITPYGFFSIVTHNTIGYVFYSNSILNSHLSAQIANNKHLTRILLERHNLPNIPYLLPKNIQEATTFLEVHKKVILKPTKGSRSHDVHVITTKEQFEQFDLQLYILEKYIKGREMRYLVLNGEVIGVLEKVYDTAINDPSIVNRISYPQEEWDPTLVKTAIKVTECIGLKFGAVDYLIDEENTPHILEVNAAPALRKFHTPTKGPAIDVSRKFLEATVFVLDSSSKK